VVREVALATPESIGEKGDEMTMNIEETIAELDRLAHDVLPEEVSVGAFWAYSALHTVAWQLERGVITGCGLFVPWADIGHCWPGEGADCVAMARKRQGRSTG
jgi:hypothetical protein